MTGYSALGGAGQRAMDRSFAFDLGDRPRPALLPALVLAALLWALLEAGLAAGHASARALAPSAPAAPPNTATLLAQTRATVAEGAALLAQRDNAPDLSSDPAWLAQQAHVAAVLANEYVQAQALAATPAGAPACLTDGLRLAATGHQLFQQAFTNDGHGAYYFSAHANWDLDMAQQQLAGCGT